jgi:Cdc6-like AAA superfamily ATPase
VNRDDQAEKLRQFIVSHVKNGKGNALYVCGAPGTGKSATTVRRRKLEVLRRPALAGLVLAESLSTYACFLVVSFQFKVIRDLEDAWPRENGVKPTFTSLNAMQCHDPRSVYAKILASIGPSSVGSKTLTAKAAEETLLRLVVAKPSPKRKMQ